MKKEKNLLTDNKITNIVVEAALEHKVTEPVLIKLKGYSSLADWFLILSTENFRQMKAVAEKIIKKAKEHGVEPLGYEGLSDSSAQWVLLDLDDIVVHIFTEEARSQYDIEGLWLEAPKIKIGLENE